MKTLLPVLGLLLVLSPLFLLDGLLRLLRRSAKEHQPRQEGYALVFFIAPGMQILLRSVMVALILFTILILIALRSEGGNWVAVLIPLSVLAAIQLAKPRPVTVDDNGVHQPQWIREDPHRLGRSRVGGARTKHWHYLCEKPGGRTARFVFASSRRPGSFWKRGPRACSSMRGIRSRVNRQSQADPSADFIRFELSY
jgi:hypothetical protein